MKPETTLPRVPSEEWITPPEVKDDPSIVNMPLFWRIVVRPISQETVSKGGILLSPETLRIREMTETVGKLVAVGPLAFKLDDLNEDVAPKIGDYVMYGKWAGKQIRYGGVKYVVLNHDELIMRVPDLSKHNQ
jgi:chaperonin GroES